MSIIQLVILIVVALIALKAISFLIKNIAILAISLVIIVSGIYIYSNYHKQIESVKVHDVVTIFK